MSEKIDPKAKKTVEALSWCILHPLKELKFKKREFLEDVFNVRYQPKDDEFEVKNINDKWEDDEKITLIRNFNLNSWIDFVYPEIWTKAT